MIPPMTHEDRLRGLVRRFRAIKADAVLMDTQLLLLLRAADLALQDEENSYANAKVRADQLERLDGKVDQIETTVAGMPLQAGR